MEGISQETLRKIRRVHIKMEHLATDILAGLYRSAFKGKGMEFEEVREYQVGDDERSVDWNVTARMNYPYVKHFREERDLTVMLLVDISASLHFGSNQNLKRDIIAEIAAVLAFSGIKNQDKIGLILFSDEIEAYLPPRKGIRHVLRIIRDLMIFTPKSRRTNVAEALAFLGKVQKRSCVVFLLSDFISADFAREAALIASKHDLIAIAVSDPLEQEFPDVGLLQMRDLESGEEMLVDSADPAFRMELKRQAEARTAAHRRTIEQANGSWIEVSTDKPYLPALAKFFKKRKLGIR